MAEPLGPLARDGLENGTGKTGYSRILRKACRARSPIDILPDVATRAAGPAEAVFTVRKAFPSTVEVRWSGDCAPPEELAAFSVFDRECERGFVDEDDEAWLRTTVKLTVRRKVQGPAMLRFAAGEPQAEGDFGPPDPGEAVTATTPENILQWRERWTQLGGKLSPRELAVLKARVEGWTHSEIAALLRASRQAVSCVFCRALKKLGIKLPRKHLRAERRKLSRKASTRPQASLPSAAPRPAFVCF